LLLFWCVRIYGKKTAGMSAGIAAGSDSPVISWDTIMVVLTCSYFFVSSLGLLLSKTKRALRIWAGSAHVCALAAYAIFFAATRDAALAATDGWVWLPFSL